MMTSKASKELYDYIIKAFESTCDDLGLTEENLPSYTAFMTYEKFVSLSQKMHLFFQPNLGCVALKDKGDAFEIKWLCVDEISRHQGHGKSILNFCETYALAQKKSFLSLGCYKENHVLVNWYKEKGFVMKKSRKDHLICFMKKKL